MPHFLKDTPDLTEKFTESLHKYEKSLGVCDAYATWWPLVWDYNQK